MPSTIGCSSHSTRTTATLSPGHRRNKSALRSAAEGQRKQGARIGWVRVVLRDGRHRWIPQEATDLEEAACEVEPYRDLPLVSVRTLLPWRNTCGQGFPPQQKGLIEPSGLTADPAVRAGIAGSAAD